MNTEEDLLIGQEFDGYEIQELLGKGGMARVYRALDVRLQRYVAIKTILPEARTDPEYARRFEREARAVAQLQHPHIVNIYRFGEVAGIYYMAMQYIDGANLSWIMQDYARDGESIPYVELLQIMGQMCKALDYAHANGVIHRDVKPANIMLDKSGDAFLTDFGLALLQTEGTRGEIFGTPEYIAPEQAVNSAGSVPQSDQYALGVILYEFLTGRLPFTGTSPMDIALAHMSEPPPPPLEYNPTLPPNIVNVLERVLSKEPEARYPNCQAFFSDVENVLQEQALTVKRDVTRTSILQQVAEFREVHPLPPIAQVNPPQRNDESTTKPAVAEMQTPHQTQPTGQSSRRMWNMSIAASFMVVAAGIVAIFLLTGRGDTATTITPQPATEPPMIPTVLAISPPTDAPQIWTLLLLANAGETIYIVNQSAAALPSLPLNALTIEGSVEGGISGDLWPMAELESGRCIRIARNQDAEGPAITCEQVGRALRIDGTVRFWADPSQSFIVRYLNTQTNCENGLVQSTGCMIQISIP